MRKSTNKTDNNDFIYNSRTIILKQFTELGTKNRSRWICNNTKVATVNVSWLNVEEIVLKVGETFNLEVNNTL